MDPFRDGLRSGVLSWNSRTPLTPPDCNDQAGHRGKNRVDEQRNVGYCYLDMFEGSVTVAGGLGFAPTVEDVLLQPDSEWGEADDEYGPWCSFLPEDTTQVETRWNGEKGGFLVSHHGFSPFLHVERTERILPDALEQLRKYVGTGCRVGVLISELVSQGATVTGKACDFLGSVLSSTNALTEDAADNYWQLGNKMEEMNSKGGFAEVSRANFVEVVRAAVGRWATDREAAAAANVAAAAVFSDSEWSVDIFESAMDKDEDEDVKQAKLLSMAGMFLYRDAHSSWNNWVLRRGFKAWRADLLGPAKAFARAFGVSESEVDVATDRALATGVPLLKNAVSLLRDNAMPALKVMATVASGGAVAAGLIVSAGVVLDWYYVDKEQKRLGCVRETIGEVDVLPRIVKRAQEAYAVSAILSDEVYDTADYTHVVRLDPFFFTIKHEVSQLKDDTASSRLISNAFLAPLINTITANGKNVLLLPASVSSDSAQHIQKCLPMFYMKVVNRSHSHAELWAVRRAFELIVARRLVADEDQSPVVLVGANVRQVSKMPRVACNYGPLMSGRDSARRSLCGTPKQRNFYKSKTITKCFSMTDAKEDFSGGTAVSFFSAQDITKQDFLETCIRTGVSQAYVAVNLPVIMMDDRVTEWDDVVLNCRYTKRGNVLSMTVVDVPVAGYDNAFDKTLSWVKPHKPIYGYDVTVESIAQVSSSYLLHLQIGRGPQESHDTVWRMPDAGHYILPDLTRESNGYKFFIAPSQKFEQVVKFVVQLNGSKNLFESTTGRILGLEAAVKIGGVTLDRSWRLSHREFVSVAVHAITCAGIDKVDAIFMLGQLREFFTDSVDRTWMASAWNGYRKLFGIEVDRRYPGVAKRGRHDYDVVEHWVCRQRSGSGWGERFNAAEDEGYVESEEKEPIQNPVHQTSKAEEFKDSGYVSADDLNSDDASGASAEDSDESSGFMGFFTKWRKPKNDDKDDLMVSLPSVDTSLRLSLPEDSKGWLTTSSFDPNGTLSYLPQPNQSKSNALFVEGFGSDDDVRLALRESAEFPAPDQGAVNVCRMSLKIDRPDLDIGQTTLTRPGPVSGSGALCDMQREFFGAFTETLRTPAIVLDGAAGAAKSTVVRALIRDMKESAVIVVPSRKLARDWRDHKVGTTVTRHRLTPRATEGRSWLIIDEVYAYTKAELAVYLSIASVRAMSVIMLGDRKQQYEDGAEIVPEDIASLGVPVMRFLVSNTMPLDSLAILKWASSSDKFVDLLQTRNPRTHSIHFVGPDHSACDWVGKRKYSNVLVYKDRLEAPLGWKRTDAELGFADGREDEWLSISRTQGSRTDFSYLLCSALTKAEKWFGNQRGLLYVAVSRHSKGMVVTCNQHDLQQIDGLRFEHWDKVDGRLTKLQDRERFDAPMKIYQSKVFKNSPILQMMMSRGMVPQSSVILSLGSIKEDWRPWPKASTPCPDASMYVMKDNMATLIGSQVPYSETDAVKYPVFQASMGLWSVRRPDFVGSDPIMSVFPGMNRLAVNQTSKDEVLDLKNVVERTARPRVISHDEGYIKAEGEALFNDLLTAFFDVSEERDYSAQPSAFDWLSGRTVDFTRKYLASDPFGLTSASVRSAGFLKTQVKVKVKRSFAMEENYGQTVIASPPDYNAQFGPWSKIFLRNVRLACRRGVFLDSGYSDSELARGLREVGAFSRFMEENYQADVKRQDTSHTPVTLRVFKLALVYFGIPEDLAELYEKQSTFYRYRSLHAGLYDGQGENNLGSGDPFTLIRNIFEVLTVLIERFGVFALKDAIIIIKGDDCLMDKICPLLPVSIPEIRATQLTEDFNRPPYHAGRFLTDSALIPDPIRMVCKAVVKPARDMERVNELAMAFYDRYVCLSERDKLYLQSALRLAYDDFEPALLDSILDWYMALRDRKVFYRVVQASNVGQRLVVLQRDSDCAAFAISHFTKDDAIVDAARNESLDVIVSLCSSHRIPVHLMTGGKSDLMQRGVWLTESHAWAVLDLDECEGDFD